MKTGLPSVRRRRFSLPVMALALVMTCSASVWACPNCKDSTPEAGAGITADGQSVARGYFWSILFMLCVPGMLVTAVGTGFYFAVRRHGLNAATPAVQSSQTAQSSPSA